MGYDHRDRARTHAPADGDTLESIAKQETASGNPITWQEIARFNWGTDDPAVVDEFLRDELGAYVRSESNRFVMSADAEVRTPLLVPQQFTKSDLATTRTHTIKVRKKAKPPKQFESCTRVEGITFEFDSDKIRASETGDVDKAAAVIKAHPDSKAMIFGHTDKVGSETYNKDLSERRARSLFTHLTTKSGVDAGQFMDPKHMGCGEFNPENDTEEANEPNRRVTVFLFHPDRLPNLPCLNGDLAPCKKQVGKPLPRNKASFHCSFYDSIAKNCPAESGPVGIIKLNIKHEDGVADPILGVLVTKERKYKAVPDPDEPGTFAWTTTSTKITLENADQQIVTVKAGDEPSASVGAEELQVTFRPASGKPAVLSKIKVTVELMEIVSNVEPKDMKGILVPEKPERKTRTKFVVAPIFIGVKYDIELRAHIQPSTPTGFKWTPSGVTIDGSDTKVEVKLKATALSGAADDKEITVKVKTAEGEFEHKHKMTAVNVEIKPVKFDVTLKSTDDINKIVNPAGLVILSGSDKDDVKKAPKIEITKIEPDLGWTDDDTRIAWWIRGDDSAAKYEGKGDFLNSDAAKYGKKIQVYGTKKDDVLIQPYSGGFGYGMYRAHVIPIQKVKYRINRILTTGANAKAPTSSHADAKKHVKVMNIYLRQAGIEMIPDDSAEMATTAGNNKIGLAAHDSKLVSVTKDSDGHFDVEVKTANVNLTFNAASSDSLAAIRINARNEVITFAYMHSESSSTALATARLCPVNHAPKARKDPPRPYSKASYTLKDKGIPSSSLIPKTGIPGDTPVGTVKMVVLFPDVNWKTTQTTRHIDLLWGISVPNTSIDGSSSATGGEATIQAYGNTLAHEVGHILGLGHRGGGGVPDGLMIPAAENIMHPNNPPPKAMDIDIIQVKAIRFSEVMFRNP